MSLMVCQGCGADKWAPGPEGVPEIYCRDCLVKEKRCRYYAESELFSPSEVRLLRTAEKLVSRIPGKIRGEWVRCHELARAVGRCLREPSVSSFLLPIVDGKFLMIEHSWIQLPNRHILDVYVPGRLPQVQLIDTSLPTFVVDYVPGEPRTDIDEELVEKLLKAFS